ncbi:MAG: polysaccharide deacetylase family protein [Cytophagales bacterium]|nr:MAG: polysaccharide deacetylase family protein [Cytophagales bacterium]
MIHIHKTPSMLKYWFTDLYWKMPLQEHPCIYLTFDDGPVPTVTDFVLETLHKYQAKGTFFCVGDNIAKYPHLFKKIIQQGHQIGNHTFHHLNGWKRDCTTYLRNAIQCEWEMKKYCTAKSTEKMLFRPPYGRFTKKQYLKLREHYKIIMWDVLTCDYDVNLDAQKCLSRSIKATENGSVVVFHDSYKAEKNLRYVLPRYIEYFSAKGFHFEAIL